MTEDQSVVGRRRIYYDQNGGETLICSDSDEEVLEEEEEKKVFAESEDYMLRLVKLSYLKSIVPFSNFFFFLVDGESSSEKTFSTWNNGIMFL